MQGTRDFNAEVYRYCSSDITVEKRDAVRWAVCLGGSVLNDDGQWEREPLPSSRDDDFKRRTRFSLDVAFTKAREAFRAEMMKG